LGIETDIGYVRNGVARPAMTIRVGGAMGFIVAFFALKGRFIPAQLFCQILSELTGRSNT